MTDSKRHVLVRYERALTDEFRSLFDEFADEVTIIDAMEIDVDGEVADYAMCADGVAWVSGVEHPYGEGEVLTSAFVVENAAVAVEHRRTTGETGPPVVFSAPRLFDELVDDDDVRAEVLRMADVVVSDGADLGVHLVLAIDFTNPSAGAEQFSWLSPSARAGLRRVSFDDSDDSDDELLDAIEEAVGVEADWSLLDDDTESTTRP